MPSICVKPYVGLAESLLVDACGCFLLSVSLFMPSHFFSILDGTSRSCASIICLSSLDIDDACFHLHPSVCDSVAFDALCPPMFACFVSSLNLWFLCLSIQLFFAFLSDGGPSVLILFAGSWSCMSSAPSPSIVCYTLMCLSSFLVFLHFLLPLP